MIPVKCGEVESEQIGVSGRGGRLELGPTEGMTLLSMGKSVLMGAIRGDWPAHVAVLEEHALAQTAL
jgi:hypothetical protein